MDRYYLDKLMQANREAIKLNLFASSISLRDPATDLVYITPVDMSFNKLLSEDIVVLDLDGVTIEGTRAKSMDYYLHILIYQGRPDVQAIIHTNAIDSMVFAVLRLGIPLITHEQAKIIGGSLECAGYALPGTRELATNAYDALGNAKACLLANAGAICIGASAEECLQVASVLESTARIYRHALAIAEPFIIQPSDAH